jgi:hypothetical protein
MATGSTWVSEGMLELMNVAFKGYSGTTTHEKLEIFFFSNDYTPADSCTKSSLTEVTTNGMTIKTLDNAEFESATLDGTNCVSQYNNGTGVIWTASGTQSIYGWAITGSSTDKIYYVKNVGVQTFVTGDKYQLNPINLRFGI